MQGIRYFRQRLVLVGLDIQAKLEPAVLAEYKHLPNHNHLPPVHLQFPDCLCKIFIQNTTNMISLIVILHGTFFNEKLLRISLGHSLKIYIRKMNIPFKKLYCKGKRTTNHHQNYKIVSNYIMVSTIIIICIKILISIFKYIYSYKVEIYTSLEWSQNRIN